MSFTGTLTQINGGAGRPAAAAAAHYTGDATCIVIVNDQGNIGSGGALVSPDVRLPSTVIPDAANDAPQGADPGAAAHRVRTRRWCCSARRGNALSIVDDAGMRRCA